MTTRVKADLGLVLATLIWGCNFVVVKAVLNHASPFVFLAVRFFLASLILAILYRSSLRNLTRADFRAGVILGLFLFAGYAYFNHSSCHGHTHHGPDPRRDLRVKKTPFLFLFTLGLSPCVAVLPVFAAAR